MTCLRPETIYAYFDGGLGPAGRAGVEGHLEECAACRQAIEERRALLAAAESLPDFDIPADFAAKIMDRLTARPERAKVTVFGWLGASAAGFVSLAAALAIAAVLTGEKLSVVLLAFGRFAWSNIRGLTSVLAKAAKYALIGVKVLGQFVREVLEGFRVLTSYIGPEIQIAAGVLFVLLAAGAVLLSRKYAMERSHEN